MRAMFVASSALAALLLAKESYSDGWNPRDYEQSLRDGMRRVPLADILEMHTLDIGLRTQLAGCLVPSDIPLGHGNTTAAQAAERRWQNVVRGDLDGDGTPDAAAVCVAADRRSVEIRVAFAQRGKRSCPSTAATYTQTECRFLDGSEGPNGNFRWSLFLSIRNGKITHEDGSELCVWTLECTDRKWLSKTHCAD